MPTQLLYLLRVRGIDKTIRSRIEEAFRIPYEPDSGYGFSNIHTTDEDTIAGRLIFSSVSSSKTFDMISNSLVAESQVIFQEVQFEFDLASGIIALRGGGGRLRKFINTIGTIAGNKVSIDPITINVNQAIEFFRDNSDTFTLTGLLIKNYKPNRDLAGRFAAKVYSFAAGKEVLSSYGTDVVEFTGVIETDDDEIKIRMSQTGAVALNSGEDGIRKGLDIIKELSSEKSHA